MNWRNILEHPEIRNILTRAVLARESRNKSSNTPPEINIFKLTSDYYFRENYHSDIIKEFLAPDGSHGEGNIFLMAFIDMLNTLNFNIDKNIYANSKVFREKHNIDILIKAPEPDSAGKYHFIIIENKINGAVDMYKQIPRYVEHITNEEKGTVDAVVYIPKNPYKSPDQSNWSDDEIKNISHMLCIIPALTNVAVNLTDNWIIPCANISKNSDSVSILRQYASLIKSLIPQTMSDNNTENLIQYIDDNNDVNITDIIELKSLIDNIPAQMAAELRARFNELNKDNTSNKNKKDKYFSEVHFWDANSCVLEIQKSFHPSMQIYIYTDLSESEAYELCIRNWKNEDDNFEWLGNNLDKFQKKESRKGESTCTRKFAYNQKAEIVPCVAAIIQTLTRS